MYSLSSPDRITQDTIQPSDTASNRATSTPMTAMKVVELLISTHACSLIMIRAQGVITACTLVDNACTQCISPRTFTV